MLIRSLCPLPVVDLRDIDCPTGGLLLSTPRACKKLFRKSDACRCHYERLANSQPGQLQPIQCPHGFCSVAVDINGELCALTSFIPFPRMGGPAERKHAKSNPQAKVSVEAIRKIINYMLDLGARANEIQRETIRAHALSLHEIRKLNRTIKHEAERLCRADSPNDPELANPQLVKIWKSSELMSHQFDVVELLANAALFSIPPNTDMEIYKLVDKCVRIYRPADNPQRIIIKAPYNFHHRIKAFDKTIQIIPTVLIENALKYSIPDSNIYIEFAAEQGKIVMSITNDCRSKTLLTKEVFRQGYRANKEHEGSGNGLYLAQMVAKQHSSKIKVSSWMTPADTMRCVFSVTFVELK